MLINARDDSEKTRRTGPRRFRVPTHNVTFIIRSAGSAASSSRLLPYYSTHTHTLIIYTHGCYCRFIVIDELLNAPPDGIGYNNGPSYYNNYDVIIA